MGPVQWTLDLDGVMWLGDQPIPGSASTVNRLRAAGHDVLFVTNNSSAPVSAVEAKLATHGVEAQGSVVTSAMAAASLVGPDQRVLVCGGPGVVEAVEARGATVVDPRGDPATVEVVVVGFTRDFDFDLLAAAATAVRSGARLIGTNTDATYPTPEGQIPGGGALLAAVATASEVAPEVAGKPHPAMVALVRARLGPEGVMVGDRISTDGRFAAALGYRFVLVGSGVSDPEAAAELDPGARWAPDLAAAVELLT